MLYIHVHVISLCLLQIHSLTNQPTPPSPSHPPASLLPSSHPPTSPPSHHPKAFPPTSSCKPKPAPSLVSPPPVPPKPRDIENLPPPPLPAKPASPLSLSKSLPRFVLRCNNKPSAKSLYYSDQSDGSIQGVVLPCDYYRLGSQLLIVDLPANLVVFDWNWLDHHSFQYKGHMITQFLVALCSSVSIVSRAHKNGRLE